MEKAELNRQGHCLRFDNSTSGGGRKLGGEMKRAGSASGCAMSGGTSCRAINDPDSTSPLILFFISTHCTLQTDHGWRAHDMSFVKNGVLC